MSTSRAIELIKRVRALAHTGLIYAEDEYNVDRYTELKAISDSLIQELTDEPMEKISGFFSTAREYPTPKTDIRAVIFNEANEILLVQEKSDGKWSLPGGWAEIGYSPREVALKEVWEETGLIVEVKKLLAVLDKKFYPHPPEPHYTYKYFIHCSIVGGELRGAHDITGAAFFSRHNIPPLSEERVIPGQIALMFEYLHNAEKETMLD